MKYCIVMPAYNAEKDINKAIDSVLSQTHEDYSLIVVNDGSVDKTREILDQYSSNSKIRVIHQSNTGISGAYKHAFQYLDGDYVLFLDSDDCFDNNVLKDIELTLKNTDADIVQFGISYFNEDWEYKKSLTFKEKSISGNENILIDYFNGLNDGTNRPNLGIRAYKTQLLKDFEFLDDGSLGIDEILNLYAMLQCSNIIFLPKAYYLCQQRTNSVSRIRASLKKVEGIIKSYDRMEQIVLNIKPQFADLLYIKFLKFYVGYINIIKQCPEFNKLRNNAKHYYDEIKKAKRVTIDIIMKFRILLFIYCPSVLSLISTK